MLHAMMGLVRIAPALLFLVACGSSSRKTEDPARAAARAERQRLEKERPPKPFELRQTAAYRPAERCGQGPYRLEMPSLRAKFGEELRVYACGLHDIAGNYRYTVIEDDEPARIGDESAFGHGDRDNAACKVNRTATASTANGAASGQASGGGGTSPGTATGAQPVEAAQGASLTTVAVEQVTDIPTSCTARIEIINMTHTAETDFAPVEGRLVLEIWSEEPNDYEGMVFVVEQHAVVADMTLERWTAYREADRAWRERYNAFIEGQVAAGHTSYVDTTVTAPPPPPPRAETPPPRPSKNARWVPGYWHYESTKFHWIAGLWDVPQADIDQELTVVAPTPPPTTPPAAAPADAPKDPAPTATAVWAPAHWEWDGRAYIWIAGAWRIPPKQGVTWQPSRWSVKGRGAIYIPGGWKIRVGR